MPLLTKATKAVTDRLPKVISPGVHAVIDYSSAAAFLGSAALLWRRHRAAAVSCLICGGAEVLLSAITDYPGGITRQVSFRTHGRIDGGLALLTASLPEFMNFSDTPQARLFDMQAIGIAATAGLTDFTGTGETKQLARLERTA